MTRSEFRRPTKFRIERAVNRLFLNRMFIALGQRGISTRFAVELETVGRRSGEARVVPVAALFDEGGAWLISQHGSRSGWALNVSANPAVRIRHHGAWRTANATLRPDDDVIARARSFAPSKGLGRLTQLGFRTLETDPVSVRLDFTD